MDILLKDDLERFCCVYQNNTSEILNKILPLPMSQLVQKQLEDEFLLFRASLFNRLEEWDLENN